MHATKTNERPGTRAVLRHCRTSAYKVRPVLDLIRGQEVERAQEILRFSERDAATVVSKLLASAAANAANNDGLDPEELYVSACFADEANTLKRWRPRARGRATRIRKRTSHVTVIVSRLPEDRLERLRARRQADVGARRARRVAGGRQGRRRREDEAARTEETPETSAPPELAETPEATTDEAVEVDEQVSATAPEAAEPLDAEEPPPAVPDSGDSEEKDE